MQPKLYLFGGEFSKVQWNLFPALWKQNQAISTGFTSKYVCSESSLFFAFSRIFYIIQKYLMYNINKISSISLDWFSPRGFLKSLNCIWVHHLEVRKARNPLHFVVAIFLKKIYNAKQITEEETFVCFATWIK